MNAILEKSSWELEGDKSYPQLTENIEADVVIVGAGLAGIFNAYILAKAGLRVVVLEKNENILQETTLLTTAFITQIIDTSFVDLIKMFGRRKANMVWQSGQDALSLIADIVKKENIECEFKPVSVYLYANSESEFEELAKEYEEIRKSEFKASLSGDGGTLNFKNAGFLEIPAQAMFHPIKCAQGLADAAVSAGAKIFTNSEVLEISETTLKTGAGQVQAKDVVIATYDPLTNEGTRFKKGMYVSYVYELEIPKGLVPEGLYSDINNPYHYFRVDTYENFDRMILGGEDHRKEIKIDPDKNFNALEDHIKPILGGNNYKITRKWRGPILEPSDGLALIGEIKPHTFVATAFSGNGMTYSAISATIVRDLILNRKNPYINLYRPKRIPSLKQLLKKGADYAGEFFGGALKNFFKSKH